MVVYARLCEITRQFEALVQQQKKIGNGVAISLKDYNVHVF